jgi:ABC-type uncharacterized transport system permease subunit
LSSIESGLIWVAFAVFFGASVLGLRVVGGVRRGRNLSTMLAVGLAALTLLFAAMAFRQGGLPISRKHEILIVVAWFLAFAAWLTERRMNLRVLAAVASPTIAMLIVFAILLAPSSSGGKLEARIGLIVHIVLALLGLAAFAFAAGVGALYLWQIRVLKSRPTAAVARRMPPLEVLDSLNFLAAAFGFPFLALSVLGSWLFVPSTSGGNWWVDPTVMATLLGMLVYVVLFGTRAFFGWYGRRIAWLTVIGFLVIVIGIFVGAYCTSPNVIHTT